MRKIRFFAALAAPLAVAPAADAIAMPLAATPETAAPVALIRGFHGGGGWHGHPGGGWAGRPGVRPPVARPPAGGWHGGAYRPPHGGYYRPPAYHGGYYGGWRRPYYGWSPGGAIAAGAAIGVLTAATAAAYASSRAPAPGLCWYYTDATYRSGFWDNCP